MSIQAPASFQFAQMELRQTTNAHREISPYSYAQTPYSFGGGMWSLSLNFSNLTDTDRREAWAFIVGLNGGVGEFEMGLPDYSGSANTFATNPGFAANSDARSTSVRFDVSGNILMAAGDYFSHGRGTDRNRLYLLTSVEARDGNGQDATCWPPLREDITAAQTAQVRFPVGLWALADPAQAYTFGADQRLSQTLELIEVT